MAIPLLATKLHAPPARRNWIERAHLYEQLDSYPDYRLTTITAPAGFGKTALVSTWLTQVNMPWTWFSLDENDNDLNRFVTYIIAAVQHIDPQVGNTVQTVLQSPQSYPPDALVTILINDVLQTKTGPFLVILDDYHQITHPAIHEFMAFWLEHKPPKCHIMLLSRQDPPLPLARWRARGELHELRERDLQFSLDETGAFLRDTMALTVPQGIVETLNSRTEGWIVGLQLAALSLHGQADYGRFITTFSGSNRYVIDYLAEEVLQQQAPDVREFLSQTSILDHLCASLCDAVTGRSDSQALLLELEQANLFLIPQDDQRTWYRYHPLFAEFLRITVPHDEKVELHQHAMLWFESHEMPEAAVHHALAAGDLSGDMRDAARLISLTGDQLLLAGQITTVHTWLTLLPDDLIRADRQLSLLNGWCLLLNGEIENASIYATLAADNVTTPATRNDEGKLLLMRGLIAIARQDYEATITYAAQALHWLPAEDHRWRLLAIWSSIEAHERTRPITEAIGALYDARHTVHQAENHVFAAIIESFLAGALNHHARRTEAITICEQGLARYTDDQGYISPIAAHLLCQLGHLHYEANKLDQAYDTLKLGVKLSEQLGFGAVISFAKGLFARVLYAQGDPTAALAMLNSAQQHNANLALGDRDWINTLEATLQFDQGNRPFIRQWIETSQLSTADEPAYLTLDAQIMLTRALLADNQPQQAAAWLNRLHDFAQSRELYRPLISIRILQALAASQLGDTAGAADYLLTAVEMAALQAYYRAFLDEDDHLRDLLPLVRQAAPTFVDHVLRTGTDRTRRAASNANGSSMIDPLSEREIEVLHLIAEGLSNREIAQELVITEGTVKRHVHHILEKLGVTNRLQATVKAREFGLLLVRP